MPPQTVWAPTDGNGEFASSSEDDIVDPTGVFLVDPTSVNIVSTDTNFTQLAATVWAVNEAI